MYQLWWKQHCLKSDISSWRYARFLQKKFEIEFVDEIFVIKSTGSCPV
jgi:hypothetical protein